MSAVLTSLVSPNIRSLIQEELKPVLDELRKTQEELRKTQEELRKTQEELRKTQEELRKTQEEKESWKAQSDPLLKRVNALAEENVRLLRHISIIEGHLNINYADYAGFCLTGNTYEDLKEEGITPFCDKMEQRKGIANEKPIEEKKGENPIIANTTLTQKAKALAEHLKKKTKPNWSGKIVLENQDIYQFFREIIQKDLRWPEKLRGYRGAKKSIIERAQELFPNEVEVVRNKSGNKITGLALKPYVKRTDTNAC
jgi:hypothetical protein